MTTDNQNGSKRFWVFIGPILVVLLTAIVTISAQWIFLIKDLPAQRDIDGLQRSVEELRTNVKALEGSVNDVGDRLSEWQARMEERDKAKGKGRD